MAALLEAAQTTLAEMGNVNATPAFRDHPLVEYKEVTATNGMSSVPRFGHSTDFSLLFVQDSSAEEREDYIQGLVFVGALVLAIFIFWTVLLLVFKLGGCCWKLPGFLSGRPFTISDDEEPTKDRIEQWGERSNRTRCVFLISGLILTIFSVLLVTQGFNQLEETRSIADVNLDNVRVLMDEASILAEDLRDVGTSAIDLRDQLVVELGKDRLCPNDPNYLAQDEITKTIEDNADAAIDLLEALGEFATTDINQMEDGLAKANTVVDDIDVVVEEVAEREWVGIAYAIPLVFFTSLMMAGTVAAQKQRQSKCYQTTLSYVILPLFIFWIVLSYVLCGALALSASANADFCTGGPDGSPDSTILLSIQSAGVDPTGKEFEIARYYLNQCTAEAGVDPFLFLRTHQAEITSAQDIIKELTDSMEKIDVSTLSFNCGRDFEPLSSSVETMAAILDRLEEAATQGLNILSCDRIVPIYANVVYEGSCNYSVTGLTWMFSCLLIIAAMGMIMIMLRSSYHNNVILAEPIMSATDHDSERKDMDRLGSDHERAMERGRALAEQDGEQERHSQLRHSQLRDLEYWKQQQALRHKDTSDSGSVYTDGNGDLDVYSIDRGDSVELAHRSSPKLYELEENSYDDRGNVVPSAPYEHDVEERSQGSYQDPHQYDHHYDGPPPPYNSNGY